MSASCHTRIPSQKSARLTWNVQCCRRQRDPQGHGGIPSISFRTPLLAVYLEQTSAPQQTLGPASYTAAIPALYKPPLNGSFSLQHVPDSVPASLHSISPRPELPLPSLLRSGKNCFDFGMSSCTGCGFKVRRQRAGTSQFSPPHLSNAELGGSDSPGLRAIHVWSVASAPPSPENSLMGKTQGQPEEETGKIALRASTETTH